MPKKVGRPKKIGRPKKVKRRQKGKGIKKSIGRTLQALALIGATGGDLTTKETALPLLLGGIVLGGIGEFLVQAEKREERLKKQRGGGHVDPFNFLLPTGIFPRKRNKKHRIEFIN